jgi:hypothetical protein
MNLHETPSFDLGVPADSTKYKRSKLTRKKLVFSNAANAALSLGFSKLPVHQLGSVIPALCIPGSSDACILSSPTSCSSMLQDCTFIVTVSADSLTTSVNGLSFLPDTGDDDELETATSTTNDRWFQNRFNEFLVHINHKPFYSSIGMYSWEVLGMDLLPRFF